MNAYLETMYQYQYIYIYIYISVALPPGETLAGTQRFAFLALV